MDSMDGMNENMTMENYGGMGQDPGNRDGDGVKAARKHFSRLGLMFVLGTLVVYAVQLIPATLISILKPEWLYDGNISLAISMVPMYLIGMPVLILLVRTVPGEKPKQRRMKPGSFVLAAIMCFALVYFSNIVGVVITTVIGAIKGSAVQNLLQNVTESVSIWAIFFYMVICAPIMEEYVFRKLIVDRTVRYGQGTAVILSGLMFGLFHGNLNQFVYAFTLGMFLAFLYVKTGKLKITIALHMMINFMGGVVSTLLTRQIDLDAYLEAMTGMDSGAMMAYIGENMGALLAYLLYVVFIFGVMIAGIVLFIVFFATKRFSFEKGEVVIPRGKRFRTVILNVGMILYSIFWIAMIIYQLVM